MINNGTIDASGCGWYGGHGIGAGMYYEVRGSSMPDMCGGSYAHVSDSCGEIYGDPSSVYGDPKLNKVYYGSGIDEFDTISGGGMIIIEFGRMQF